MPLSTRANLRHTVVSALMLSFIGAEGCRGREVSGGDNQPENAAETAGASSDGATPGGRAGDNSGGSADADAGSPDTGGIGGFADADAGSPGAGGNGATDAGPIEAGGNGGFAEIEGDGGTSADSADAGSPIGPPGYQSGTRLKAMVQVAGGAQRFVGWHDSMLGIDCNFQFDSDGIERCMPASQGREVMFADANCTQPSAVVYGTSETPDKYLPERGYSPHCNRGPRFLAVGAATSTRIYRQDGDTGACGSPQFSVPITTYQLGNTVSNDTFVAVSKTEAEPLDDRVAAVVRTAADGSRQVLSSFDLSRKAQCSPHLFQEAWACLPDARASISLFFSDAGCTVPAAVGGTRSGINSGSCAVSPDIAVDFSGTVPVSFYEVGAPVTSVYVGGGAQCSAYGSSAADSFYAVGETVPLSAFPQLAEANEGVGRMRVRTLKDAAGSALTRGDFYDSKLGVTCAARTAMDGVQRCLPKTQYAADRFSDSECKQGMLETMWDVPPLVGTVYVDGPRSAILKVGARINNPTYKYAVDYSGNCTAYPAEQNNNYYAASLIAPSDLVAITTITE